MTQQIEQQDVFRAFDVLVFRYESEQPIVNITIEQKPANLTVYDLKQLIYRQVLDDQFIPERQQLYYKNVEMSLEHQTLEFYGIQKYCWVRLADKGYQVPLRPSKVCLYFLPPVMYWAYQQFHTTIYTFICKYIFNDEAYLQDNREFLITWEPVLVHWVVLGMLTIHFGKLQYETFRIHRYSYRLTSWTHVFWEGVMYWFILGCVGFSLHHTNYLPWHQFASIDFGFIDPNLAAYTGCLVFIVAELMNFRCKYHFYQQATRLIGPENMPIEGQNADDRVRQAYINQSFSRIIKLEAYLYKYITGAEIFWELWAWLAMCLVVCTPVAWIFFIFWTMYNFNKIQRRHERYVSVYGYDDRYYIIPKLI